MRFFRHTTAKKSTGWKLRGVAAGMGATGLLVGMAAFSGTPAAGAPQAHLVLPARGAGLAVRASHTAAGGAVHTIAPRHGRFLGIMPAIRGRSAVPTANGTPPLTYHGGPVQHSSKVYAIVWAPSGHYLPPGYRTAITQYFTDVAAASYKTSNVYAASTQYYDNTGPSGGKNWVSYNVSFGGSTVSTAAAPTSGCTNYTLGDGITTTWSCMLDSQLQTEISNVVSSKGWQTGLGTEYFLFTPPGMGSCFDTNPQDGCYDPSLTPGYCAYHSNIGGTTLYANQPWADISGCQYPSLPDNPYPNDNGADTTINVVSHEQNETMTDPLGTAWFDSSGFENGDECAWLALTTHFNGIGDYSQTINSDEYLMQTEWSNRKNGCVPSNTFAQPTGSFTAGSSGVTHGESFTASASDSDDTAFTYGWSFGDGQTTLTSSATVTHTYAAAGTYTVTLVIFDAHGDQVRVTKSVAVP